MIKVLLKKSISKSEKDEIKNRDIRLNRSRMVNDKIQVNTISVC